MTSRTLSKERIISAAVELINEQENLTFTNLSRKLGTRSQAIYNYYPDAMAVKIGIATNFYDTLIQRLQADLLGLSGKQAIKAFANVSVQYAMGQYLVAQQIFSIPSGKLHNEDLDASVDKVRVMLRKLLYPLVPDEKERFVISRMLRNLVVGEIIHIGNGRFVNKAISARDSFDQMLEITLANI